jgi:hypothetical protein
VATKGVVIPTPDNLVVTGSANASWSVEVIRMDVILLNADTRGVSAPPFGEPVTITASHTSSALSPNANPAGEL